MSLPAVDYGRMSSQDPNCFVSLHSPDGTEIDVGGYERQPIDLIPDPESDSDTDSRDLVNGSKIEFPPLDSRVTVDRVGIWTDDELLAVVPQHRGYSVQADTVIKIWEGHLKVERDELPSEMAV